MAYGEMKVTGDDVVNALTTCSAKTAYETVLNDEGEKLAQLIATRVLAIVTERINRAD